MPIYKLRGYQYEESRTRVSFTIEAANLTEALLLAKEGEIPPDWQHVAYSNSRLVIDDVKDVEDA